jgi:hypothetical protein
MEFVPTSYLNPRYHALEKYLLSRLDKIDEREISDLKLAEEVFLLKHRKELAKKAERRVVPKVLEDIDFILNRGWGKRISKDDFNHVHLCVKRKTPMFDVNTLFSTDNVRLLYHTLENIFLTLDHANRNIISSLKLPPAVMPIHLNCVWGEGYYYTVCGPGQIGIGSTDLGLKEYGKLEFEENRNGLHKLKNGRRLKIVGRLADFNLLLHTRVNRQGVKVNGKTIT